MKFWSRTLALSGMTAALLCGADALAQRPGNFDPEQMRERFSQMMRERLDVKDDAEWKLIEERIAKVNEARREAGGFGAFGGFGGGGFGGRNFARGGDDQGQRARGNRAGGRGPGASLPEAEALRAAIERNASPDEIKQKLAKYREARKAKEAALAKAREELRQVLSVRQEAVAVTMGLLE